MHQVEMVLARLRALTHYIETRSYLNHFVEMVLARLRALIQFFMLIVSEIGCRRNGISLLKGIDT